MRETQWKKVVYVIFYCILIIFFLWKFGHPAVVKYISNEVFLKISTSPADRSRIEKISLPAITFCASEVGSFISQGWTNATMFYNDMISVKCNSSTSLGEVYECINQQTFNISQMIPALAKGASQPEVITDPSVWVTDVTAVFMGKCHTLRFKDKVGSYLETNLLEFNFNPAFTYDVFIHDPKYYLATLNPAAFPHIRLKRKPNTPLNESKNLDLMYVSETRHTKLNRYEHPCEEEESYDFRECVKRSVYSKVGCKMEWDRDNNKQQFPLCTQIQQLKDYEREFLLLSQVEEREVIEKSGCLPPCSFSQFSLVHNIQGFFQTYGMGLVYATTEVQLEEEDWVYPNLSFIAEFGGALGMFIGFSFMSFWDCFEWGHGKCKKKSNVEDMEMTGEDNQAKI